MIWALASYVEAQVAPTDRFVKLEQELEEYAMENPRIDKLIDISITGTLKEFAIAFSKETRLNLTIDPNINQKVVTNFSDTRPRDILLHLCKFYQLDLSFSGTIISLIPYQAPVEELEVKVLDISYNSYNDKLQLNLQRDTLDQVVQKISELSQKNVITTQRASALVVDGYVGATQFEDALEQLAKRNELLVKKEDKGYYTLDLKEALADNAGNAANAGGGNSQARNQRNNRSNNRQQQRQQAPVDNLFVTSEEDANGQKLLTIDASNVPLGDVIKLASQESEASYFLFAEPSESISMQLEKAPFADFLDRALSGTKFTYKEDGGLFLIGEAASEGMRETRVIQLQHRSVKELTESIPKDLASGVDIQEFIQLNSLILTGPAASMNKLEEFLGEIDRSVPVVMIELLILDVQQNLENRAGLEAGLATEPRPSGGTIFPGVDFTFSTESINRLLATLSGNGIVNLGQVRPNFYATLQAVEDNGYVKVRSKPRLSTLNGLEASLSLGETRYFLNERTTLQGNQNPISLQDRRFEAVNADFSIRIVPIVSGDEYVTLEIEVNQSDFIGQVQTNAPPPQVNRTFNSNIRILNQEMIALGGLETKSIEDAGTGVPFLSRIPVIKWLFSSRRRAKNKNKLLVFVKPTVIY
ncbi:MAG: secretin N-terminal domain-containing protein [Bacteroidota bacterium]